MPSVFPLPFKRTFCLFLTLTVGAIFFAGRLSAQGDPVLFTVNHTPVYLSEFKYIYSKTNGEKADFSQKSLDEYLDLYTKFKMKVQRARDMKLDTIQALKDELAGYRKQLADSYLTDREVTEKLIREAFDRMQKDVNISHILVTIPANASPEDQAKALQKIKTIQARLEKGETFVHVAQDASEDKNSRDGGGNIGWVTALLPDGFYELESAVYNAPVGTVTPVTRSPLGYHLVKINETRPARGEVEAAHILIRKTKEGVVQPNAKKQIDSIYARLQSGEKFEELAKSFSEDYNSASRGGYLGYFGIGRFEKDFEDVAFSIPKDNAYSAPFESSIGWHIIKRLNKKTADTFEASKARLKARVQRDGRYELARMAMLERIKREGGFQEDPAALQSFTPTLDTTFLTYKWKPSAVSADAKLFSFGKQKTYTMGDFSEYLSANANRRLSYAQGKNMSEVARKMYGDYVTDRAMAYEETQLESKYPDFKALMREYEEGVLLFEAIKINVWDKASLDSAGLEKFYAGHKDKYKWDDRAVVTFYALSDSAKTQIADLREFASKKDPQKVLKKFNEKKDAVSFRQETVERGKNPVVDQLGFEDGKESANEINRADKSVNFLKIEKIIPKTNKSLREARGYVVADYQDYLEKEWIKELQNAYKLNVNRDVLNTIVKK